ncbi:protease HtpX [Acrasis kona]|uniref:Protease HtpX n=1 Tax=Acrasis kona TaxID=1008807 RepID=A0AAW2ZR88_9EUKA
MNKITFIVILVCITVVTCFQVPNVTVEVRGEDEGCKAFKQSFPDSKRVVQEIVLRVIDLLYKNRDQAPDKGTVKVIVRPMDGVAYTANNEINFSSTYIAKVIPSGRVKEEMLGVLTHEMTHVFQYNVQVPGGLIEGIADFIRLRAGLAAPHWKKEHGGKWDAGYQKTAMFLDFVDKKRPELVRDMNYSFRLRYQDSIWKKLTGKDVNANFDEYQKSF